jgi:predicted RecB family nuclease
MALSMHRDKHASTPIVDEALSWVSKTNVADYLRCPYAFSLLDSGQIERASPFSPFQTQVLDRGVAFERGIVERASPLEMPPGGHAELVGENHVLFRTAGFKNVKRRLIGRPDGIVTANGALEPIEIKSHRLLRRSDRIELAFYWLLLAHVRTVDSDEPAGWVFLRQRDGSYVQERVRLTEELLAETEALIAAVRLTRIVGAIPVVCGCACCAGIHRERLVAEVRERQDLSAVWGLGRAKRAQLAAAGYHTWADLIADDAAGVATTVNSASNTPCVSAIEVDRWQTHVRAFMNDAPVLVGRAEPFPVPDSYIAFDAEYTAIQIWLLGARVVLPCGDLRFSWWSNADGEARAVADFDNFLHQFAELPVVTWSGRAADLPALRKAASRAGRTGIINRLEARHIDLLAWVTKNLRLPIPGFGLKEISEYFSLSRESLVRGGLEAQIIWNRYQRTGDQELKAELVGYNRDDLNSLVGVSSYLRACANCQPMASVEPLHPIIEDLLIDHESGTPTSRPDSGQPKQGTK